MLIFAFQPVADVYYGAPGFYYIVGYRQKAEAGTTPPEFTKERVDKNLTYANEFEIPVTSPNVEYEFYVHSGNEKGMSKVDPVIRSAKSGDKRKFGFLFPLWCLFLVSPNFYWILIATVFRQVSFSRFDKNLL